MRGRLLTLCLLGIFLLAQVGLGAEVFTEGYAISCREDLPGCLLLQMVFMGSFSIGEDPITLRVLSAAYPRLCKVTEEDIEHFEEEFGAEEDEVEERLYRAMANALYADIWMQREAGEDIGLTRRVLWLFLNPEEKDAKEEMEIIREGMDEEVLAVMAEEAGCEEDFLAWLIGLEEDDD